MQQEDIHTNAVEPLLKNFLMTRIPQRWICHNELIIQLYPTGLQNSLFIMCLHFLVQWPNCGSVYSTSWQ